MVCGRETITKVELNKIMLCNMQVIYKMKKQKMKNPKNIIMGFFLSIRDKKDAARRKVRPQKVGSKLKRRERVYKRTAKVRRDFLRKRRSKEAGGWLIFVKK